LPNNHDKKWWNVTDFPQFSPFSVTGNYPSFQISYFMRNNVYSTDQTPDGRWTFGISDQDAAEHRKIFMWSLALITTAEYQSLPNVPIYDVFT
jgi:hypothetical protein